MPTETGLALVGMVEAEGFPDTVAVNVFDGPDVAPIRLTVNERDDSLPKRDVATAWLTPDEALEVIYLLRRAIGLAQGDTPAWMTKP